MLNCEFRSGSAFIPLSAKSSQGGFRVQLELQAFADLADEFQAINDNFVFIPFILVFIELFVLIKGILLIRKRKTGNRIYRALIAKKGKAQL